MMYEELKLKKLAIIEASVGVLRDNMDIKNVIYRKDVKDVIRLLKLSLSD